MGPPHSGLWLSATVGGESAFKREGEGELLSLRQPMGRARTTGYSPPPPPSIISAGLSVQVICRGFHHTKSRHSEDDTLKKLAAGHFAISFKTAQILLLWTHLCNNDTGKYRKCNVTRIKYLLHLIFYFPRLCSDSRRFTSAYLVILSSGISSGEP